MLCSGLGEKSLFDFYIHFVSCFKIAFIKVASPWVLENPLQNKEADYWWIKNYDKVRHVYIWVYTVDPPWCNIGGTVFFGQSYALFSLCRMHHKCRVLYIPLPLIWQYDLGSESIWSSLTQGHWSHPPHLPQLLLQTQHPPTAHEIMYLSPHRREKSEHADLEG